jgi:hypothetical protein
MILYQLAWVYAGRASPAAHAFAQAPVVYHLHGFAYVAVALIAVLAGRAYWTIWAAAAALLGAVTDVLRATLGLDPWAFYSAQIAWFVVLCASILTGALPSGRPSSVGG